MWYPTLIKSAFLCNFSEHRSSPAQKRHQSASLWAAAVPGDRFSCLNPRSTTLSVSCRCHKSAQVQQVRTPPMYYFTVSVNHKIRWTQQGPLLCCCKVTKSCLTLCNPHGLQHTRLPCPSTSPGVCSNSCPLSQWCHPIISSSVSPFSSCPQSFPASGSFPMSRLSVSDGWSSGASTSTSVLPINIQGWFSLGLAGLIALLSKGLSSVLQHNSKVSILWRSRYDKLR